MNIEEQIEKQNLTQDQIETIRWIVWLMREHNHLFAELVNSLVNEKERYPCVN